MDHLRRLVREAHRRSLWQVLGVYLVTAWIVVQVVNELTRAAGLPDWVPPFALVLLLIGFPVVVATAVVQEGGPGQDTGGGTAGDPSRQLDQEQPTPGRTPEGTDPGREPARADSLSDRSFLERHLTWRRAIGSGIVAFSLLGLLVGAYFLSWSLGIGPMGSLLAAGELEEGDWIVLADFQGPRSDPDYGTVVSDLLRIDFAEHPAVRVAERADIRATLERMQVDPDAVLTADLAREIAVREGMTAVLEGEVSELGAGYVISAVLRSAESGESLASMRETAATADELIPATERLSERIRERAGESLRSIRAGPGLEQVTTSSLAALRLLSEANRAEDRGDFQRAIELLEEAVEKDPEFAMAWRKLAVVFFNAGGVDSPGLREASERAYELRDRLTARERYLVEAYYHRSVEEDLEAAARAYHRVLEIDPDDTRALNNLSVIAIDRHDYDLAVELLERLQEFPSPPAVNFFNLIRTHLAKDQTEEARTVLERFAEHHPGHPSWMPLSRFLVTFQESDDAAARAVLEEGLEDPAVPAFWRSRFHLDLGQLHLWRGRLDEARVEFDASEQAAAEVDGRVRWEVRTLTLRTEVLAGDPDHAAQVLLDERDLPSVAALAPEDRHYARQTMILATAGRLSAADAVLREWEAEMLPETGDPDDAVELDVWRILLAEDRADEAIELLESYRSAQRCPRCRSWPMGWALREAGRLEEAAREWEYAATPAGTSGLPDYIASRLWSIRKLAPVYEELGETELALHYYRRLVELWEDADPELQPQVEHARERIAALEEGLQG